MVTSGPNISHVTITSGLAFWSLNLIFSVSSSSFIFFFQAALLATAEAALLGRNSPKTLLLACHASDRADSVP
jgi:hypothetical protein